MSKAAHVRTASASRAGANDVVDLHQPTRPNRAHPAQSVRPRACACAGVLCVCVCVCVCATRGSSPPPHSHEATVIKKTHTPILCAPGAQSQCGGCGGGGGNGQPFPPPSSVSLPFPVTKTVPALATRVHKKRGAKGISYRGVWCALAHDARAHGGHAGVAFAVGPELGGRSGGCFASHGVVFFGALVVSSTIEERRHRALDHPGRSGSSFRT